MELYSVSVDALFLLLRYGKIKIGLNFGGYFYGKKCFKENIRLYF